MSVNKKNPRSVGILSRWGCDLETKKTDMFVIVVKMTDLRSILND